jgi:hypothetical protein
MSTNITAIKKQIAREIKQELNDANQAALKAAIDKLIAREAEIELPCSKCGELYPISELYDCDECGNLCPDDCCDCGLTDEEKAELASLDDFDREVSELKRLWQIGD